MKTYSTFVCVFACMKSILKNYLTFLTWNHFEIVFNFCLYKIPFENLFDFCLYETCFENWLNLCFWEIHLQISARFGILEPASPAQRDVRHFRGDEIRFVESGRQSFDLFGKVDQFHRQAPSSQTSFLWFDEIKRGC